MRMRLNLIGSINGFQPLVEGQPSVAISSRPRVNKRGPVCASIRRVCVSFLLLYRFYPPGRGKELHGKGAEGWRATRFPARTSYLHRRELVRAVIRPCSTHVHYLLVRNMDKRNVWCSHLADELHAHFPARRLIKDPPPAPLDVKRVAGVDPELEEGQRGTLLRVLAIVA